MNEKDIKPIAPVIFDLAFQMEKTLNFLETEIEEKNDNFKEYIINFAKLFNFKNVKIKKIEENPILYLKKQKHICIITPYNEKPASIIRHIFYPKLKVAYSLLNEFNQFLIPQK